jgi:hypothetical protein
MAVDNHSDCVAVFRNWQYQRICWQLTLAMLQEAEPDFLELFLRDLIKECVCDNVRGILSRYKATEYKISIAYRGIFDSYLLACSNASSIRVFTESYT